MLTFLSYETLFENFIIILLIIYQNKTEMRGKKGNAWFIYKKFQVLSSAYKLFEYIFL